MAKFPLFIILLFIGVSAFSQTRSEKEIKELLAHKWKPTHLEEGGQKMLAPAEADDWFIDIKADGTLITLDSEGLKKGKWSYDYKTKNFIFIHEIDPSDPWKFEVIKISDSEIVIKATLDGITTTMYFKRVN